MLCTRISNATKILYKYRKIERKRKEESLPKLFGAKGLPPPARFQTCYASYVSKPPPKNYVMIRCRLQWRGLTFGRTWVVS